MAIPLVRTGHGESPLGVDNWVDVNESDSDYWVHLESMVEEATAPSVITAPLSQTPFPTTPSGVRSVRDVSQIRLLAVLGLFLLDTFLPWQRVCIAFGGFGLRIDGCLSASAWSGTAALAGQVAGILAILSIALVGMRISGMNLGEPGRLATRVGVYGAGLAGIIKWIAVMPRIPGFGAWVGLVLLIAIGILETANRRRID